MPPRHSPASGIKVLYDGINKDEISHSVQGVDIVAIHGIGADPDTTWSQKLKEGGKANWLSYPNMLAKGVPNARIMRFGYESNWFGSRENEFQDMHPPKKTFVRQVANMLLGELEYYRRGISRPIIFIAHSYGGLVLIQALRSSFDDRTELFSRTVGLVFFGTPFRGRQGLSLQQMVDAITEQTPDLRIYPETMALSVEENPYLEDLVIRFTKARNNHPIPIMCFYETKPSPARRVLRNESIEDYYVVPEASACLDHSQGIERGGLERHHYNLQKFASRTDMAYSAVRGAIVKLVTGAESFIGRQQLSEEEYKCLQLLRLTSSNEDITYQWYKDLVKSRIDGTCEWFLKHEHFQKWLDQDSGLLLVSADPGCGKSVLAKYLIDHGLPRSATICYFFFKSQIQNTVRQALCAILHQLFMSKPFLLKHAMAQFRGNGDGLINSTSSLWAVFGKAVRDAESGPIMIVIDALDECGESDFRNLIRNIQMQFNVGPSSPSKSQVKNLKYILTSRPYTEITSEFQDPLAAFPYIRIPGEDALAAIGDEINLVITHQAETLSKKKKLSDQINKHLIEKLLEIPHRTYLWVYLLFDYLDKKEFKKTKKGIESEVRTLPKTINQAYEEILNRSQNNPIVRKALSIILVAARPLTVTEMNVALNVEAENECLDDLDLEADEDFQSHLRYLYGLFVSVHHERIYFIHQTAREFLLATPATSPVERRWQHCITDRDAHLTLAEICVRYLDFLNSNKNIPVSRSELNNKDLDDDDLNNYLHKYTFLSYSAKYWGTHFSKAYVTRSASIIPLIWRVCDKNWRGFWIWFNVFAEEDRSSHMSLPTPTTNSLSISSVLGLEIVAKLLIERGANADSPTSLLWASQRGHIGVVKLLLENGATTEHREVIYHTPLILAAIKGHVQVINLLLEHGADINYRDYTFDRTPLIWAALNGKTEAVSLLLEHGAEINSADRDGQTALSFAVVFAKTEIENLLLKHGADIDDSDDIE